MSTVSCSRVETSPSGSPGFETRLTEKWRCSPSSARVRLYWRGWWTPSGMSTLTVTYWPGSELLTSRSSMRRTMKVTTSAVSRILRSTCHGRYTRSGRTPRAL